MVTFRVESTSRSDALALASELARHHYYRWYLIEPDARHWDVYIPVEQPSRKLPEELRQTIRTWLRERHLKETVIHTSTDDLHHRQQPHDRTVLRGAPRAQADEPLSSNPLSSNRRPLSRPGFHGGLSVAPLSS